MQPRVVPLLRGRATRQSRTPMTGSVSQIYFCLSPAFGSPHHHRLAPIPGWWERSRELVGPMVTQTRRRDAKRRNANAKNGSTSGMHVVCEWGHIKICGWSGSVARLTRLAMGPLPYLQLQGAGQTWSLDLQPPLSKTHRHPQRPLERYGGGGCSRRLGSSRAIPWRGLTRWESALFSATLFACGQWVVSRAEQRLLLSLLAALRVPLGTGQRDLVVCVQPNFGCRYAM
jgi:hypothetical protein